MPINKKAFQLAISTLVVIVLGIFLLIGLVYILTDGFKTFKESTEPFTDTVTSSAIKQACTFACEQQDKLTYCCKEYDLDDEKIKCTDTRLSLDCTLTCEPNFCTSE